jgi:HEAT repeat protein
MHRDDRMSEVLAALEHDEAPVRRAALAQLVALNTDHTHDASIQAFLVKELDRLVRRPPSEDPNSYLDMEQLRVLAQRVCGVLDIAARTDMAPIADAVWPFLGHRSRLIRKSAARTLATLREAGIAQAAELLVTGDIHSRAGAAELLARIESERATRLLEERLDAEDDDDVRDIVLERLDAVWTERGKTFTRAEIEAKIVRTERVGEPIADWVKEAKLPALHEIDGKPLDLAAVRYLMFRQSRVKDILLDDPAGFSLTRPNVCLDLEAKHLFARIDRRTSGDFALELLQQFLKSRQKVPYRWAMTMAAALGDGRIVPLLVEQVTSWCERNWGQLAEHAARALALVDDDQALVALDALTLRYRTKHKNVSEGALEAFAAVAERRGVSVDELGDLVVPALGFESNATRTIDGGKTTFDVRVGLDFKLKFFDVGKKKAVASLPKSVPAETAAEFKALATTLREVSKAQCVRLENMLMRQHRWPAQRWQELFRKHPLLVPFGIRLVWGVYDPSNALTATFRALDDGGLTTSDDASLDLPATSTIGIVHPLELDAALRLAWQTHLADNEVEPPFPQLQRLVFRPKPEQRDRRMLVDIAGKEMNALTFKGRASRSNWVRASVGDGASVLAYAKRFSASGVDAILSIRDMYIYSDADTIITLEDLCFVPSNTFRLGGYIYDFPSKDDDERALRLGDVPAVTFSETMADIQKIAGDLSDVQ